MSELRFGRYFILETTAQELFGWAEENLRGDAAFYVCGMCSRTSKFVINGIFEQAAEREYFEQAFLNGQKDIGSVYSDRRDFLFEWPAAEERRTNVFRRQFARRGEERESGRRLSDFETMGKVAFT